MNGGKRQSFDQSMADALCSFARESQFRRAVMQLMAWSLTAEERAEVRDAFLELDKDTRQPPRGAARIAHRGLAPAPPPPPAHALSRGTAPPRPRLALARADPRRRPSPEGLFSGSLSTRRSALSFK